MNVLTVPRTVLAFEYAPFDVPSPSWRTSSLATSTPRTHAGSVSNGPSARSTLSPGAGSTTPTSPPVGNAPRRTPTPSPRPRSCRRKREQTKAQADAALGRETKAAEKQRAEAARDHREEVAAAAKQESQHKAEAIRQAKARAGAEKETIARQVEATVAGAAARQHAQNAGADNQLKMATAAPTAELADANATEKEAAGQRADADRLAQLAETEKRSRQN